MTDLPAQPRRPARPPRSSTRNILTVMGGTLSSRLLGQARQTLFNRLFSPEVKDAFNVAYNIPNLFRELLAEGALTSSIIPIYKGLPEGDRARFASCLAGVLAAANLVLVALGIWLAPLAVGLRTPDGSSLDIGLTVTLTRIVWPFLTGISFSALAMALLNAEEQFQATAFSPLAFSLVSILGFLAFPHNALALAWVTTVGGFAQFLVQVPALRRFGLLPRPRLAWHPALTRALGLMAPYAFTTGTREFLAIVLIGLLGRFGTGAITGFRNAESVFLLVLGLFAVSPALASYPRLSEQAAKSDWAAFRDTVTSNARLVLVLCTPAAALTVALGSSVVSALYDWAGRLDTDTYRFTLAALSPLALAAVPWGLNQYLVRTFYARQRTREAVAINVAGFLVNTALYYLLARSGYVAMNYATTATGWAVVVVYLAALHRQIGLNWKKLVGHTIKVGLAALLAGLVAHRIAGWLPDQRGALLAFLRLLVAGGVGLAVYLGLAATMRIPELEQLRRRVLRR